MGGGARVRYKRNEASKDVPPGQPRFNHAPCEAARLWCSHPWAWQGSCCPLRATPSSRCSCLQLAALRSTSWQPRARLAGAPLTVGRPEEDEVDSGRPRKARCVRPGGIEQPLGLEAGGGGRERRRPAGRSLRPLTLFSPRSQVQWCVRDAERRAFFYPVATCLCVTLVVCVPLVSPAFLLRPPLLTAYATSVPTPAPIECPAIITLVTPVVALPVGATTYCMSAC